MVCMVVCGSMQGFRTPFSLTQHVRFAWPTPHHLQVKNKMSKADFLRNNRGINDGGDLPQVQWGPGCAWLCWLGVWITR